MQNSLDIYPSNSNYHVVTKSAKAIEFFKNSFNCSQSVLCAFSPETGLTEDASLKVACAFGAGMGRRQLTCGAVTGALMVLGMKYGKGLNDPDSFKSTTYEKSVLLMDKFRQKHGSITCKELLNGLDMVNDYEKIKAQNLFEKNCALYVKDAVAIVEQLLD